MEEIQPVALLNDVLETKSSDERSYIVELMRRFGGFTADAVLDPSTQNFHHKGINGFIGYRAELGCAIVFGDPICAPSDRDQLAKAFHLFADSKGYKVIYICASQEYAYWAMKNVCGSIIEYGEELVFHPPTDPRKNTGTYGSLVRRKTKQATREGVTVQEYIPHDAAIQSSIEEVKDIWLKSRRGPQIHISNPYLFMDCFGKRWFYAKQGDRFIGVIALNRMDSRNGWLLNHLMVIPEVPNGVPELLMTTVLETLEKEGCPFATVGSIAAHELGEIKGLGGLSSSIARTVFNIASKVNHLEGLNTFWGKFQPKSTPSYLLFSRKKIGIRELLSLQRTLNGNLKEGKNG